jgi:hypothetical protein
MHARVENDFTNHPPDGRIVSAVFDEATRRMLNLAHWIVDFVPAGREQSLALTKLEECSMQVKAGIARNQEAVIAFHTESEG